MPRRSYETGTTTGPGGNTIAGESEIRRTEEGFSRTTVTTGPDGAPGAKQEVNWVYDPDTKTWKRDVRTTGPQGNTATGTSEYKSTTGDGAE